MLTNTASDLGSHVNPSAGQDTYPCHNRAAQIAGVAGEGDASTPETIGTEYLAVTCGTSGYCIVVRFSVLTHQASDIRRCVSVQPIELRQPVYTASSQTNKALSRLDADGVRWGPHPVSTGGEPPLGTLTAAPSTQRPTGVRGHRARRCVLGRIAREAGIRRQRGRGWGRVRGCDGD